MGEGVQEIVEKFQSVSLERQAEIIMRFSDEFKSVENEKPIEIFLSEIDKKYGLGWESIIPQANHFVINFGKDEKCLDYLFQKFPNNTDYNEILVKVIMINNLYSTRLNDHQSGNTISTKEMADYIKKLGNTIDDNNIEIPKVVSLVGDKKNYNFERKVNSAYSFASKYLSFTYRNNIEKLDKVPITDTYSKNVITYMVPQIKNIDQYSRYYQAMSTLKDHYKNINSEIGYKEIDAFLWIIGKAFSIA